MSVNRRKFIMQSARMVAGYTVLASLPWQSNNEIMTVNGWIAADKMGFALTHEHILVDFIGADKIDPSRYNADEVFNIALPKLLAVKEKGCQTLMECTPAWLGRDVKLLKRLSEASGLNIVTNTGYYGAAGEKYLPAHAYTETAEQVAARWIAEWENGIDDSGIKPGFIKSGVDKFPLSAVQQKMVEAATLTHLATGLTIGMHTGDGKAAMEELRIIQSKGISAQAWIWIHAQNEQNRELHIRAAKAGGWVSFDGVSAGSISSCVDFLKDMKKENLLDHVLLSHDAGWYHVGEPNGGNYNDYNTIAGKLIPALKENGFTEKEIRLLFFTNPAKAFTIRIRKM
jgi:predicted metal-dependent phosphotriesterase family hydrolase